MTLKPSGRAGEGWAAEWRILIGLSVIFSAVNVGLRWFAVPPEALIAADSLTFQRMAEHFLATGTFSEEERQPLYPLVMAVAIRLAGENGLSILIGLQIAMLYATGWIAWVVTRPWLDANATIVFGLVILNPNAVGVAHWPLADTLHALLFTGSIWALLAYGLYGRMWRAWVCGGVLGLAALTRPETSLLVFLLPIAVVSVHWAANRPRPIRSGVPAGLAALVVAIAVALPWMSHNASAGYGFVMTGGEKTSDSTRGHFAIAEAKRTGLNRKDILEDLFRAEPEILAAAGLEAASASIQRQYLVRLYLSRTFEVGPKVLFGLYSSAWVAQFASGGAQSINLLVGLKVDRADKFPIEPNALAAFIDGLKGQPVAAAITVAAVGFAVFARVLGLLGIVVLGLRRHWPLLLVIAAVLVFKALVHLFFGLSRYRLPVEPLLMILAVFGWQGLRSVLPRRR